MTLSDIENQIATLWNEGNSAGVIARITGRTRNVIAGCVYRMRINGVELRTAEDHPTRKRVPRSDLRAKRKREDPKVYIPPPPKTDSVRPIAKPISLALDERWVPILQTGRNTCKYTEDGRTFCNSPEGFPYCPEHKILIIKPR